MGYRIQATSQRGLVIPAQKTAEFADAYAKAAYAEFAARHDQEAAKLAEKGLEGILAAGTPERKAILLLSFLKDAVYYPFEVAMIGDGSLRVDYFASGWGEVWNEKAVLETLRQIAKYAKAGSYLGFIGEDMDMWSYAFDGSGSFREVFPTIDWLGENCGLETEDWD